MKEYTEILKGYLGSRRDVSKEVFKIAGRIYRGVNNDRFTIEEALQKLNKKVGVINER